MEVVLFEVITSRVGGLDVHKKQVTCAIRSPGPDGERLEVVKQFSTFNRDLHIMAAWLKEHGVTDIGMEATGIYWVPVWRVLESYGFDKLVLANPARMPRQPGRKTDRIDASWIAQLLECGMLTASFVPERQFFELRGLTRYRKKLIGNRSSEILRAQKLLEDAGIKIDSVISNINGVSGRQMLDALIAGERDVKVLAQMAHGKMRNNIADIELALVGFFDENYHAKLLRVHLDQIDYFTKAIDDLSAIITEKMEPYEAQLKLLETIPGIGRRVGEVVIAEAGIDMSVFPTAQHLASWAGMCPGNRESAGKRKSGKTRKGNQAIRSALCEAAWATRLTKDTYLGAQFQRFRRRFGGKTNDKKVIVAVGHSILVAVWNVLSTGEVYSDPGADYFIKKVDSSEARKRRHIKQLEELGYSVTLEEKIPA